MTQFQRDMNVLKAEWKEIMDGLRALIPVVLLLCLAFGIVLYMASVHKGLGYASTIPVTYLLKVGINFIIKEESS